MRNNDDKSRSLRAAAVLLACAPALAGCQFFGLGKSSLARAEMARPLPIDFGEEQLAAGREALEQGRTSDAIDSFMLAKLYPQHAAAAFNGLAVAYSRLGRTDLTERYFQFAVSLDPTDDRFRSNLALFYDRNGMSRTARQDLAQAMQPALVAGAEPLDFAVPQLPAESRKISAVSLGAGLVAERSASRLTRISGREVHLADGRDSADAGRKSETGQEGAQIVVTGRRSYPVRIRLPEPSKAKARAERRPAYPIRIALPEVLSSSVSSAR